MCVLLDRTMLDRSGCQRAPVHGDGVVHEELDPHGREIQRSGAPRAVRGRLVSEEELGAVDVESGNDMAAIQVPEKRRAKRGLVERDGSVAVADGQHGRDLGPHRVDSENSRQVVVRKGHGPGAATR